MADPAIPSAEVDKLISTMRQNTAAVLVAAIVAARGQPTSVAQVLAIHRDVHFAMYPQPALGTYQEWAKTKDDRLQKVHD